MIEIKYGKRKVMNYRGARMVVGGLTAKNKVDILLYISKELANISNREELFQRVITLADEIFEPDNVTLRLAESTGLEPVAFLKETDPPRRPVKPGEGYSGTVFEKKESMLLLDLENYPEYLDNGETTRSVICVPISTKDEVFGTLAVEKDISAFYKKDDQEILESMASQLGLALVNVKLIQGLIDAREKQEKIQDQLEWDLRMGRNVQSQIIPTEIVPWNSISFSSYYEPMVEVSGDYYNVLRRADNLSVLIADVSGHGVPAALVTMALHYHFKTCVDQGLGLVESLEEISRASRPILPEGVYFTAQIIRIYADHSFSYVNAGHHKLVHYHYDVDSISELDTPGLPIGFVDFNRATYEEKFGNLSAGDILLMLTDGFSEQRDKNGVEITSEQILQWLSEEIHYQRDIDGTAHAKDIFASLIRRWKSAVGGNLIEDDLTMLIAQVSPSHNEAVSLYKEAKSLSGNDNTKEALTKAIEAYSLDSSLKDNLLLLSRLYYRDSKLDDAARYLKEFIEISGEQNPQAHFMLGSILFRCDNFFEAKREFKKSLSIDHTMSKASLMLARCYLKESAYPKAYKILQNGLKSSPNDARLREALEIVNKAMNKED